jgi:septum formation protein
LRYDDAVPQLVLASASPRRLELLRQAGLSPSVIPADVDETPRPKEDAAAYVGRLAAAKARAIASTAAGKGAIVLGADTIVVDPRGALLGKPTDEADARRMLTLLSGATHRVLTGFAVIRDAREREGVVQTEVEFRALGPAELDGYLASREWEGKAGAYAIQGLAGAFVRAIRGSYSTVVGLPLCEVVEGIGELGGLPKDWPRGAPI